MMAGRHGERLDAWISQVDADDQPDLHRFANGVRRDYDAVDNGLTLEHSSGAVEGSVNRIKMIKRQMYGRAGFELLRKRSLLARIDAQPGTRVETITKCGPDPRNWPLVFRSFLVLSLVRGSRGHAGDGWFVDASICVKGGFGAFPE